MSWCRHRPTSKATPRKPWCKYSSGWMRCCLRSLSKTSCKPWLALKLTQMRKKSKYILGVPWLQVFVVCACLLVTMFQMQQMPSESYIFCPYIYAHNTDKLCTQICVRATVTALIACLRMLFCCCKLLHHSAGVCMECIIVYVEAVQ